MSKLAIPDVGVDDPPTVCLEINKVWVTYILTALRPLEFPGAWEGTADELYAVLNAVSEVEDVLVNGN